MLKGHLSFIISITGKRSITKVYIIEWFICYLYFQHLIITATVTSGNRKHTYNTISDQQNILSHVKLVICIQGVNMGKKIYFYITVYQEYILMVICTGSYFHKSTHMGQKQ